MALYAFDGTWNEAKTSDDTAYKNTNVFRFYEAYHAASNQNDFYVPGVGTRFDALGQRARRHPRRVRHLLHPRASARLQRVPRARIRCRTRAHDERASGGPVAPSRTWKGGRQCVIVCSSSSTSRCDSVA